MIRIALIIFLSLFIYGAVNAQNKTLDSLKLELRNANHDTTKIKILILIGEQIYPEQLDSAASIWKSVNEKINYKLVKDANSKEVVLSYKKSLASSYNNLGFIQQYTGNIQSAIELYEQSLKIRMEINDFAGIAESYNNIGYIFGNQGDFEKALNYHKMAQKLTEKINDKKGMALSLSSLAYISSISGDQYKAIEYYSRALKLRKELGDKKEIAYTLLNLAVMYDDLGDIKQALDYYNKSLQLCEEIGDKKGMSELMNDLGILYNNQGEEKMALEYWQKAIKLNQEIGDLKGEAYSLINISKIYRKRGNIASAFETLNRSLETMRKFEDKMGMAVVFHNMADIYSNEGDKVKALEFYNKSLLYSEEIKNKTGIANALRSIAAINVDLNKLDMALELGLRSMKLSKELGQPENIKDAAYLLKDIYYKRGNYKLSIDNFELYLLMRDSLRNLETQKKSIKLQARYEFDKEQAIEKEKHTAVLKLQEQKSEEDNKKQRIIIVSVSILFLLVALFSLVLFSRFKTIKKQKVLIELQEKQTKEQKDTIEEKQKEIIDSINYAKRIQYALLAHTEFLNENLPVHFTLFQPKDIVSGDFYWATKKGDKFFLAVCDSTGHGVPGAFMSLLNIGFLSEAINEKGIEKPNEVFDHVRQRLMQSISKEGQKDGFDGVLICIDQITNHITYSAANNNPVLIHNNELMELESDRMPVGMGERKEEFKIHTIDAKSGDILYLYTDGYADQFGGPRGKKFKYKQLNELLLSIHPKPLNVQHVELKNAFENWKGNLEQVDDVCVIGIKL